MQLRTFLEARTMCSKKHTYCNPPSEEGMPTVSFWSVHITVSMPFCTEVFNTMQIGVDRWQVDLQC